MTLEEAGGVDPALGNAADLGGEGGPPDGRGGVAPSKAVPSKAE